MDRETVSRQISTGFKKANKSYCYDDDHDKSVPIEMWFQESHEGLILFVVFYSQACRWSQCTGCNLPSKASLEHVGFKALNVGNARIMGFETTLVGTGTLYKVPLTIMAGYTYINPIDLNVGEAGDTTENLYLKRKQ